LARNPLLEPLYHILLDINEFARNALNLMKISMGSHVQIARNLATIL